MPRIVNKTGSGLWIVYVTEKVTDTSFTVTTTTGLADSKTASLPGNMYTCNIFFQDPTANPQAIAYETPSSWDLQVTDVLNKWGMTLSQQVLFPIGGISLGTYLFALSGETMTVSRQAPSPPPPAVACTWKGAPTSAAVDMCIDTVQFQSSAGMTVRLALATLSQQFDVTTQPALLFGPAYASNTRVGQPSTALTNVLLTAPYGATVNLVGRLAVAYVPPTPTIPCGAGANGTQTGLIQVPSLGSCLPGVPAYLGPFTMWDNSNTFTVALVDNNGVQYPASTGPVSPSNDLVAIIVGNGIFQWPAVSDKTVVGVPINAPNPSGVTGTQLLYYDSARRILQVTNGAKGQASLVFPTPVWGPGALTAVRGRTKAELAAISTRAAPAPGPAPVHHSSSSGSKTAPAVITLAVVLAVLAVVAAVFIGLFAQQKQQQHAGSTAAKPVTGGSWQRRPVYRYSPQM